LSKISTGLKRHNRVYKLSSKHTYRPISARDSLFFLETAILHSCLYRRKPPKTAKAPLNFTKKQQKTNIRSSPISHTEKIKDKLHPE